MNAMMFSSTAAGMGLWYGVQLGDRMKPPPGAPTLTTSRTISSMRRAGRRARSSYWMLPMRQMSRPNSLYTSARSQSPVVPTGSSGWIPSAPMAMNWGRNCRTFPWEW
jgi:hypothetical protein